MSESKENPQKVTVACRVPRTLKSFYKELAEREQRDLSDVLRIVLEDQARVINKRGGKLLKAA